MKKVLFIIGFLLVAAAPAVQAQKVDFKEVINSSITINTVACSSFTATLMDSTMTVVAMPLRAFVAFQNHDPDNKVAIGFSAGLSTATANIMIPENYAIVSIPLAMFRTGYPSDAPLNVWCRTTKAGGSSNVSLIQGF